LNSFVTERIKNKYYRNYFKEKKTVMRSDLIYDALDTVRNRYLLCQLISKATRKFHKPNTRVQETMNDVLVRVGKAAEPNAVIEMKHQPVAQPQPQRRAA
jgi:hypothetical protein